MIHILNGSGSGKTSAALGLTIRHLGHGGKVLFVSFCKGSEDYELGEELFFKKCNEIYHEHLQYYRFGDTMKWESKDNVTLKDRQRASKDWKIILDNIKDCTLLVLDEASHALKCSLISQEQILKLIEDYPEKEVILTGRSFPRVLQEKADYLTHLFSVKHPFFKGVQARRGFDY